MQSTGPDWGQGVGSSEIKAEQNEISEIKISQAALQLAGVESY